MEKHRSKFGTIPLGWGPEFDTNKYHQAQYQLVVCLGHFIGILSVKSSSWMFKLWMSLNCFHFYKNGFTLEIVSDVFSYPPLCCLIELKQHTVN